VSNYLSKQKRPRATRLGHHDKVFELKGGVGYAPQHSQAAPSQPAGATLRAPQMLVSTLSPPNPEEESHACA
jgi:hypothetical protein